MSSYVKLSVLVRETNKNVLDIYPGNTKTFVTSFHIIEKAGNYLPEIKLSLATTDELVIKELFRGDVYLVLSFGKDLETSKSIHINISDLKIVTNGPYRQIDTLCYIESLSSYVLDPFVYVSDKGAFSDILKKLLPKYFKSIDINIDKSIDNQSYISYNQPMLDFVDENILSINLENSFPVYGITSFSKFKLFDFKNLLSKPERYVFSNISKKKNTIMFEGISYISNTNVYRQLERAESLIHEIDTGSFIESDLATDKGIISKKPNKSLNRTVANIQYECENMQKGYWSVRRRNLLNLTQLSSLSCTVTLQMEHLDLEILDVIKLEDFNSSRETSIVFSGVYIVSKILRLYKGNRYLMEVTLVRDSIN